MKQIIILSLLLYYISCKTLCSTLELNADENSCLSYEPADKSNSQCCYIEVKAQLIIQTQLNICYSFPKGANEQSMKHIISEAVKAYSLDENTLVLQKYICNKASYLKVGFLLLSLFLF